MIQIYDSPPVTTGEPYCYTGLPPEKYLAITKPTPTVRETIRQHTTTKFIPHSLLCNCPSHCVLT